MDKCTVWCVWVVQRYDWCDEYPEEFNRYFKTEEEAKWYRDSVESEGGLAGVVKATLDLTNESDLKIYNELFEKRERKPALSWDEFLKTVK